MGTDGLHAPHEHLSGGELPRPRPMRPRSRRVVSWLGAVAALLAVAALTTALLASHLTARTTAATKTPVASQLPARPTARATPVAHPMPSSAVTLYLVVQVGAGARLEARSGRDGSLRWHYDSASAFDQPLLADGLVYLAQQDGQVIALDASSGSVRWRYAAPEALYLRLIAAGILYAGSFSESSLHSTYALGASDGALLWRFAGGEAIAAAADGAVYVSSLTASASSPLAQPIYALNASNGSVRWHFQSNQPGSAAVVALGDGNVYVEQALGINTQASDALYVLNAQTGALRWTYDLTSRRQWISQLTDAAGLVYLFSVDVAADGSAQPGGRLIALNASDGAPRWQRASSAGGQFSGIQSFTLDHGVVYFLEPDHTILALRASDGALLWQTRPYDTRGFLDPLSTPLTVADGLLYLELQTAAQPANSDAPPPWVLLALDPTTGHVVWKHDLGGLITLLTARDGVVYGGWLRLDQSGTGQLFALNANDGTAFWTVNTAFSTVVGG